MNNNFKVKVNSKWEFPISNEELKTLDIVQSAKDNYHILQDNNSHHAKIVASDFENRTYSIKINGTVYLVSIQNQLDLLIKEMGFSNGSSKNVKLIKANINKSIVSTFFI